MKWQDIVPVLISGVYCGALVGGESELAFDASFGCGLGVVVVVVVVV